VRDAPRYALRAAGAFFVDGGSGLRRVFNTRQINQARLRRLLTAQMASARKNVDDVTARDEQAMQ
jgi:hypothetical protein